MQFRYETDYWKRTLAFLEVENLHFKNRLAEVVELSSGDDSCLKATEAYLNNLRQVETMISIIKNDIATFEKLRDRDMPDRDKDFRQVVARRKRIRDDIKELATQFNNIKSGFDNFLMETYADHPDE